jgi:2'-5' RNA ligase
MERLRVFIALNLPVAAVNQLVEFQGTLRDLAQAHGVRVGWVAPTNLHLTLRFLGEVPIESAYAVRDMLSERLRQRPALSLAVRGLGAFPAAGKPRILWIGAQQQVETLAALVHDLEQWLEELGFPKEPRSFHPHFTLGRIRDLPDGEGLVAIRSALEEQRERVFAQCMASEVVFYSSKLERRGAEYTPIQRYRLQGNG